MASLTPKQCGGGLGRVIARGVRTMLGLWYGITVQSGYRMILVGDFHLFGIKFLFGTMCQLGNGEESQGWPQDCVMQLETDFQIYPYDFTLLEEVR